VSLEKSHFPFSKKKTDPDKVLDFDFLYKNLRIGFSEWQLYTYFLSTLKTSNYAIGMLGPAPHPLVSEFNINASEESLLADVLHAAENNEKRFPNFIYFYPGLTGKSYSLVKNHLEAKFL